MQSTIGKVMRVARTLALLALATTAGAVGMSALRATDAHATTARAVDTSATSTADANAKRLLKSLSDYMAAQTAFSFDYDTHLEVVSKQNQKLGLASSGHDDRESP